MAKIVIMEDDVALAYRLSELLTIQGHDVSWESNGTDAKNVIDAIKPDLLVTDIYVEKDGVLSGDGGILLIGRLRSVSLRSSLAWQRDLPIVVISGAVNHSGNQYILDTAKSVGASHVLGKPFSDHEFLEVVNEAMTWERPE